MLSVFATHSLTVHERSTFYEMLGLDATEFDTAVVRETNNTSARAFPVILNVDHPEFFKRLDRCADRNLKLKQIAEGAGSKVWKMVRKAPLIAGIVGDLLRLYLLDFDSLELG